MWLRTQKDEENLVSALISTLEDGQRRTGANCLNSLIAWLKEKDAEGEYFHVESQEYSDQTNFDDSLINLYQDKYSLFYF